MGGGHKKERIMGSLDAGAASARGIFDWSSAYGTIDWVAEMVENLPEFEVCGDGLFTEKHLHLTSRAELEAEIKLAQEELDSANQRCMRVLAALP